MPLAEAEADWERRHPQQIETWAFDFWSPATGVADLAGFVGFTYHPRPGRSWCWAALVGAGRPYLLVRDLDLDPPTRPGSRQLRGSALWADANCETPHAHWSVGLEAFGVALDDPDEALRDERGDRTGLGLDLEWEADGSPVGGAGDYAAAAEVHGEILVGAGNDVEAIAVTGAGLWRHMWGPIDSLAPRSSLWGRGADGTTVALPGGPPADVALTTTYRAPLRLEDGDRYASLVRTFATFESDGQPTVGWLEQVSLSAPAD